MGSARQAWGKCFLEEEKAILTNLELENNVQLVDPARDALFRYDEAAHRTLADSKPWASDPRYFHTVRISAVALLKMVMHARSGGSLEVMGLMQGYIAAHTLIVTDAFRLPVEGTETRVNAQDEANEYMVSYLQSCRDAGRLENAVGWYHSHPGYGCWLSGIDVSTQAIQQQFNDPFVAVVIDPDRTISAGKVEIGAFRTYPAGHNPASSSATDEDGYESIPVHKAEDFGAHTSQYYALEVAHFKSSLDARILSLLWNKYWVATLSQSPLLTNRDYAASQMRDLSQKIRGAGAAFALDEGSMGLTGIVGTSGGGPKSGTRDQRLDKAVREGQRIVGDEVNGLMASQIKRALFHGVGESGSGPGKGAEAMGLRRL